MPLFAEVIQRVFKCSQRPPPPTAIISRSLPEVVVFFKKLNFSPLEIHVSGATMPGLPRTLLVGVFPPPLSA